MLKTSMRNIGLKEVLKLVIRIALKIGQNTLHYPGVFTLIICLFTHWHSFSRGKTFMSICINPIQF